MAAWHLALKISCRRDRNVPFSLWEPSSPLKQITLVCDNLNNFLRHILTQSLLMVVWDVGGILFEANYAIEHLVGCDR